MKKRIIALLCALFILIPTAVACAETSDGTTTTQGGEAVTTAAPSCSNEVAQTTAPEATTEEETTAEYPAAEIVNLGGFVYRSLVLDNNLWAPIYFAKDGQQDGTYLNDALYRREAFLEEKYNVQIEFIVDSNAYKTLDNNVSSGTDLCEAV